MSTTIIMPQLGESVAEGVIGKWLKNEGDSIEKDEPIVEVITDKVNAEIPSPVAGTLEKIVEAEGATVAVGQPIGIIGDGSKSAPEESGTASTTGNGSQRTSPGGDGGASMGFPSAAAQMPSATSSAIAERSASTDGRSERVRSSPLVRRLAEEHDINLADVPGTGIAGRVSKQDIMAYVSQHGQEIPHLAPSAFLERESVPSATAVATPPSAQPLATARPAAAPALAREPGAREERIPIPPLRKMIAARMVQSKFTIPHATTVSEVDMTACVRYRESQKNEFRQREGVPLSYVAIVVKTTVEALKEFPMVNAEWADDAIILKHDININVAVDAPDGLTTPVIHNADEMSLAGISKAINDLAIRARDKKLKIEDMQGGTFTVNNTGAIGSISGVPIINYPQAGILAAAAIVKRPVVIEQDGEDVIAIRSMMNLGMTFDHRLLDGGYAAGFVKAVKDKLEAWPQNYPLY